MDVKTAHSQWAERNLKIRTDSSSVDGPDIPQVVGGGSQLFQDFMTSQINSQIPQLRHLVQERFHISQVSSSLDGPLSPQVVEQGSKLFQDFMTSQIDNDASQLQKLMKDRPPESQKGTDLYLTATRLRQLAISFSQTDERQQVKKMAQDISPNISGEELSYLLQTMLTKSENFEDGIVVIFFFCFDLVVRLLKMGLTPYMSILELCATALVKSLGPKVEQRGGWTSTVQAMRADNSVAMSMLSTGMMVVARLGLKTIFNT